MNIMTSPQTFTAALRNSTTRMPLLTALAEHRRLHIALKDVVVDGTPDERALYAIEDDHLSGAVPANLAEAAALLKWALIRSGVSDDQDAILRGEAQADPAGFDLFFAEAWTVACFIERQLAGDAEIDAAFSAWQRLAALECEIGISEQALARRTGATDRAVREIAALSAATPRGAAIKAFVLMQSRHGATPRLCFLPNFCNGGDRMVIADRAMLADLVASVPEIARLIATPTDAAIAAAKGRSAA